jgi:phosphoglycerate dehydrogenase-like enzyme
VLDFESMVRAIPQTHYVVLACPLTSQTLGLVDSAFLAQLPQGAFLINVARGQVVNQTDLIDALGSHLGGAFLDVFATEPLEPDSPLWHMPHVMVSPHTAGHFSEHAEKVAQLFMHNLNNHLCEQTLLNEWHPS